MRLPQVTIIIAAYNEREILLEKVRNCYALNYPADLMDILVITDGSTDGSEDILQDLPLVRTMHLPERAGKLAAVNRAMQKVKSPIVVLTDANCMLNKEALTNIVRHYQDPNVGAVSGEKQVLANGDSSGQGEGLYWKYESFLKKLDSDFNSVVGAAGELFSFRRELYEYLPTGIIIEDFVLAVRIAEKGYRVVYEPSAIAQEEPSSNMKEEWKRKVRICAGGFQAIGIFLHLLNPKKFNRLSFQFFSHRLLRWAVVPFLFPLVLALTIWQVVQGVTVYEYFLILQVVGYSVAAIGLAYANDERIPKVVSIPFQFAMMNAAAYAGLVRFIKGTQSAVWEKSKRKVQVI